VQTVADAAKKEKTSQALLTVNALLSQDTTPFREGTFGARLSSYLGNANLQAHLGGVMILFYQRLVEILNLSGSTEQLKPKNEGGTRYLRVAYSKYHPRF
jgi:hypothetical protein